MRERVSVRVKVKICGITRREDALRAAEIGADFIGFVFCKSPRQVTAEAARAIGEELPPWVLRVGVFMDQPAEEIEEIVRFCRLDLVQLHGQESPAFCQRFGSSCIKAVTVRSPADLADLGQWRVPYVLLDAPKEGKREEAAARLKSRAFNWEWAKELEEKRRRRDFPRLFLAGGLNADNVGEAIGLFRPFAVDVASGIEAAPGVKDYSKMKAFVEEVRRYSGEERDEHC